MVLLKIGQKASYIQQGVWLPVYEKVHPSINAITFKFVNNAFPHYLNEVYE